AASSRTVKPHIKDDARTAKLLQQILHDQPPVGLLANQARGAGHRASWQYHRNAAFRRQILGILSVLPRKRGVPSRVSSFRGGTAKMRPRDPRWRPSLRTGTAL